MQMKSIILIILLLLITFNAEAGELIKKGEALNLERCIEIALTKHPNIVSFANTVKVNQSRVGEAAANYYPQIDLTSGYSRISSSSRSTSDLSTDIDNTFDEYTGSVTLKQNLYDFGKTAAQVRVQDLNLDSSRADLENASQQIVLNVKQAYYGVLKATRDRDVAEEAVKQSQQHLEQAKGFYEVGTKPKFDVTKAEVDLSNSRLNLIRAENALRIAIVTLNNAMGVPEAPEFDIEDNLSFQVYVITFDEAIMKAYKNRPDLESIIFKRQSAESSVTLAEKGYYPALTGSASYSRSGEEFPLDEGWNAGVTLSFPIFSGFLTKHQVGESRANLNVQRANEEALRQNIFLEVQQAYLNLKEAGERIPAAGIVVKQAEENLELANGRYKAGVGNPIEVTDAQVSLSSAKSSYIQALYDYKTAHASLEKAMGERR
ncbi:MAG: TolC family protein [Nitrospirae bacterium]|nr:TolC family protein [Nitrospirota bacterium]